MSTVIVPDEEAIAAYRESLVEVNKAKLSSSAGAESPRVRSSWQPDSERNGSGSGSSVSRGSSPSRVAAGSILDKRGTDPTLTSQIVGSPTNARIRTISAARSKAETAFRTSFSQTETDPQNSIRHLVVDFRLLPQFPSGPDLEIVVTLCSKDMREHITEPFFFVASADGKVSPTYGGKSTRTVFRELPLLLTEAFLLVRIYRKVPVNPDSSNSKSSIAPRRPCALGMLDFSTTPGVNRIGLDIVETIPLYIIDNEALFWRAHDPSVVKTTDLKPAPSRPIGVTLCSLPMADSSPDAAAPAQRAAEIIAEAPPTYPLQSITDSGADPQPIPRNDLYITLCDASFALKKPLLVEVSARLTGGVDPKNHVPLTLRRGSGTVSTIASDDTVIFHVVPNQGQPKWDETIVVRLPNEVLRHGEPKIPLVLTIFVHCLGKKKKKEVGKGQVILADPSGPISNGAHSVVLSGSGILAAPGTDKPQVKLRTLLIRTSSSTSTLFNRLAAWRTMRLDDLMEIIQSIPQSIADLPYSAISDTLEALVGVLDTQGHDFVSAAIISAFCATVGACTDDKQPKQLREALDNYIDAHCTGMKHPERLYGAMAKYLEKPKDKRSSQILAALRSLTYISRICALSAFAQPDGSPPPGPALFKSPSYIFNLDLLLRRLIDIITSRDAELYSAQIAALRGIPMLLDHVAQIVKARDAASLISMLITEINPDTAALVQEKVRLIDSFARSGSPILEDIQIRSILWPTLIRETIRHIKVSDPPPNRVQVNPATSRNAEEEACRLAVVALHQLIDFAQSKSSPDELEGTNEVPDSAILDLLLTSAAPTVGSVLPKVPTPIEATDKSVLRYGTAIQRPQKKIATILNYSCSDMAMAFLATLYVVPAAEFHRILDAQTDASRNSVISSIVEGLRNLMATATSAAFPADWDEMIQFQYRSTETCLAAVATYLTGSVLTNLPSLMEAAALVPQFPQPSIGAFGAARTLTLRPLVIPTTSAKQLEDTLQMLRNLLAVMATFVISPQLEASELSDIPREGLLAMADELRDSVAYSIAGIWNTIGPSQIDFLEHMMRAVIIFSLAKAKSQKKIAKMMIVTATEQCRERFKESSRIVSLFLETLSRCFGDVLGRLDGTMEAVQAWAVPFVSDILGEAAAKPIQPHIASVVSLLYDIEMTPPELDIDARILHVAQLIELLTFLGERRALSYHLSSLASLHLQCGTTVEAGYVLAALAENLPWSSDMVEYLMPHELLDASVSQQRTTYTSRKIRVITEAMELLAMGAQWEEALAVSMPLAAFFDSHFRHSDYLGVAKKQLLYVEAMTDHMRVWPSYWYIKFSGPAFPEFTQSSAFIIANYALESQQDMMRRLQVAYPTFPISYGVGLGKLDPAVSRIDVSEVSPYSADANIETECLASPTGQYAGADSCVAHHRMRRRARHWRCTVKEGDKELDYEFETLLSFPALVPRLPIVGAKVLETRSLPSTVSGRLSPPIVPPRKGSAPQIPSSYMDTPPPTPAPPPAATVVPVAPSALIPSLTPKERTPSRAGSANRVAILLSLPASQQLQQQIVAAQTANAVSRPIPLARSQPILVQSHSAPSITSSVVSSSTPPQQSPPDVPKKTNSLPKSPRGSINSK